MKLRIAAALTAGLLLSGCSDAGFSFSDILGFPDEPATADAAAPAQPGAATVATAQAQAPSVFCRNVAQQDATANGFDAATQARMAQKSYAQCVALFGSN